jgi:hypothetical protein
MPTTEEILRFLASEGYTIRERRALPQEGVELLTDQGPVVHILPGGVVRVEGPDKGDLESKL